jgi:hypothetical protein
MLTNTLLTLSAASMAFAHDFNRRADAAAAPAAASGAHGATATPAAAAASHAEGPGPADFENMDVQHYLGYIWVAVIAVFIIYQFVFHFVRYVRTVACLTNETQRYFAQPHALYTWFKRNLLNAPLFKQRHHREFKLSSAINIGTLPSRLQTLLLVGYFSTNVLFCVWSIDWSGGFSTVAGEFRNRTGVMAVINMIPLFLLAGRNNPFIALSGISFDTMNLIHRWFGRIVVLEALCHTIAYMANKVHTKGWVALQQTLTGSQFMISGFIGTIAFTFLLIQSPGPVRHAFYDTFLHFHIIGAGLAVGGVWIHLKGRPQLLMMYGVVGVWATEVS